MGMLLIARSEQNRKKFCKKLIKGFEGVWGNFFQKFPYIVLLCHHFSPLTFFQYSAAASSCLLGAGV